MDGETGCLLEKLRAEGRVGGGGRLEVTIGMWSRVDSSVCRREEAMKSGERDLAVH